MIIKKDFDRIYELLAEISKLKRKLQEDCELRERVEKERDELEYDKKYYVEEFEREMHQNNKIIFEMIEIINILDT